MYLGLQIQETLLQSIMSKNTMVIALQEKKKHKNRKSPKLLKPVKGIKGCAWRTFKKKMVLIFSLQYVHKILSIIKWASV